MNVNCTICHLSTQRERGLGVVFSVAAVWTGGGEGNRLCFEDALFFESGLMCTLPAPCASLRLTCCGSSNAQRIPITVSTLPCIIITRGTNTYLTHYCP